MEGTRDKCAWFLVMCGIRVEDDARVKQNN